MKNFKRFIATLLALVMLYGTLPAGVLAEEWNDNENKAPLLQTESVTASKERNAPLILTLGENKTATVEAGTSADFTFTPERTGHYRFTSDAAFDTYGWLYDENMTLVAENDDGSIDFNFSLGATLEAGKTYTLRAKFYSDEDFGDLPVCAEEMVNPTTLVFKEDQPRKFSEKVDTITLDLLFGPENALCEDVTVTLGDPTVLKYNSGLQDPFSSMTALDFSPLAAGTTTVTATTESGLTDTVTITVLAAPTITTEVENTYSISGDTGSFSMCITIEEDGIYDANADLIGNGSYSYSCHFVDAETMTHALTNSYGQSILTAGNYYLTVYFYELPTSDSLLKITASKQVPATDITITNSEFTGYVGEDFYIYCEFLPENAIRESYTVTSSNPAVATVAENDTYLQLLSAGTSLITVTTQNNLTQSFTLTVSDTPNLESIELWSSHDGSFFTGTSFEFAIYQYPEGCNWEEITWTVSDPELATVTPSADTFYGTVAFLKEGTFTLTATSESGLSDSMEITVLPLPIITENTSVTLTLYDYANYYVGFAPSQGGWYRFKATTPDVEAISFVLYDDEMDWCADSTEPAIKYNFEAGKTYVLQISYEDYPETQVTFAADKLVPATGMSLPESISGYEKGSFRLKPEFSPENAIPESIVYQSADPNIAWVDETDGYVTFVSPGTTTITATGESHSKTVSVTVLEAKLLALGQEDTVTLKTSETQCYKFIPVESGHYFFEVQGTAAGCYSLSTEYEEILSDWETTYHYGEVLLTAGSTYYLQFHCCEYEDESTFTSRCEKMPAATALNLNWNCSTQIFEKTSYELYVSFEPENCYEEDFTLSSNNPELVEIDGSGFTFTSPGTATITATSESGLTDSITLTALAIPELEFGAETEISYPVEEYDTFVARYSFTPEETGNYCFTFTNASFVYFEFEDGEPYGSIYSDLEHVNLALEKDVCYIIAFRYNGDLVSPQPFKLKITEPLEIQTLELVSPPDIMEYVKGFEDYNYTGLKLKATLSDNSEAFYTYDLDNRLAGYIVNVKNHYLEDDTYEKTVVSCGGKEVEFSFRSVENPIDHLELAQGTRVTYIENCNGFLERGDFFYYRTIYPSDVMIKVVYKDQSSETVSINDDPVPGYFFEWSHNQYDKPWSAGTNDTTISYLGKTVTLPITVLSSRVQSLELVSGSLTLYEYGDGHYEEGVFYYYYNVPKDTEIKINYEDGSWEILPFYDENGFTLFEFSHDQTDDPWELGAENTLEIYYQDTFCTMPVNIIENPVESISLLTPPTPVYYYGDNHIGSMDGSNYYLYSPRKLDGLSFRINYKNGTHKDVFYEDFKDTFEVDGYYVSLNCGVGPHRIGQIPVTLSVFGKTLTYQITLTESPIQSLEVVSLPEQPELLYWASPDFRGAQFKIHYKAGGFKTVTLDPEKTSVSGYESPYYTYEVEPNHYIEIYEDSVGKWIADYLGVSVVLKKEYDTSAEIEKVELSKFNSDIKGSKFLITYVGGSTETVTVTEVYGRYSDNERYGNLKTEKGFLFFEWEAYPDERAFGRLKITGFGSFIIPLDPYTAGDLDGNDEVTIDDAIYLLFAINFPDTYPLDQLADFDGSGEVTIDDAIYLLFHVNFQDSYPLH